jgi:hypothetical protein
MAIAAGSMGGRALVREATLKYMAESFSPNSFRASILSGFPFWPFSILPLRESGAI